MEIRRIKLNENEYTFVCESYSNSRAWGHRVVLLRDCCEIADVKIRYYNRTWECYRYQTTMAKAIRNEVDRIKEVLVDNYKYNNGTNRVSQKTKEEIYAGSGELKEYEELLNIISDYDLYKANVKEV